MHGASLIDTPKSAAGNPAPAFPFALAAPRHFMASLRPRGAARPNEQKADG